MPISNQSYIKVTSGYTTISCQMANQYNNIILHVNSKVDYYIHNCIQTIFVPY